MRQNKIITLLFYFIGFIILFSWFISFLTFGRRQVFQGCTCAKSTDILLFSIPKEIYPKNTTIETLTTESVTMTQTKSYDFLQIFSPLESRCRGHVSYYVTVLSKKGHRRNRENIRKSWASLRLVSNNLINSIFVVGFDNKDKFEHEEFIAESKKYKDIYYSDYQDNEESLLDLYMDMLKTAVKCSSAKYYILVHDHTFINLHNIINVTSFSNVSLFCNIITKNPVIRDSTSVYYVSKEEYSKDIYPNHCQKYSPIIISADLAHKIVNFNKKPMVKFFDVYLFGILPKVFDIPLHEFPKEIVHVNMRPHHVFAEEDFGFLSNGEVLPTTIWTKLMLNMVLKEL